MSTKEIIKYTQNIEVYKDDIFDSDKESIYLQFTNVKESSIFLNSLTNTNSITLKISLKEFKKLIKNIEEKLEQ